MQSFKEEPTYTEVNPGENTELRCVVNDIGGECRWQKDGKVSIFVNLGVKNSNCINRNFYICQSFIIS